MDCKNELNVFACEVLHVTAGAFRSGECKSRALLAIERLSIAQLMRRRRSVLQDANGGVRSDYVAWGGMEREGHARATGCCQAGGWYSTVRRESGDGGVRDACNYRQTVNHRGLQREL